MHKLCTLKKYQHLFSSLDFFFLLVTWSNLHIVMATLLSQNIFIQKYSTDYNSDSMYIYHCYECAGGHLPDCMCKTNTSSKKIRYLCDVLLWMFLHVY